jgi:signal transduction histidine kinase
LARGRRLGGEGNPRVLGILSDVTDRRTREEENRRLAAFQQQLMGIVGHDLRNPLSAIITSAEVLRQSAQEPAQVRTADRIRSSALRASRMIGDLLDYTQASLGGGLPVSRRPSDVHEIAEQVVEELRAANPDRRILCSCGSPALAELDPDRMAQVISNLVSNALTYSPPEEKVEVEVRGDGGGVELRVRNRGEPIPAELLPVIFEPFKRGDEPGAGKNVGLGLFIVREIVAAHGGVIDVTSTAREGTSFRVRLPREPMAV